MIYNDFQILNDNSYKKLANAYNTNKSIGNFHVEVYKKLLFCSECLCINKPQINNKILLSLNYSITVIEQILENFKCIFNLKNLKQTEIKEINLFEYVLHLINIVEYLNIWQNEEKNNYYKNFIFKTINELILTLKNIFSALNKSNIKIYKFI